MYKDIFSWLALEPIGDVIEGTRFVALKTPMSKEIFETNKIDKSKYFTPKKLARQSVFFHFTRVNLSLLLALNQLENGLI